SKTSSATWICPIVAVGRTSGVADMLGVGEAGTGVAGGFVAACGGLGFVAGELVPGGGLATKTTFSVFPWQLANTIMNTAKRINRKRISILHDLLQQPSYG